MSEVATVLGGLENVEKAVINIATRAKPELIGICSTGVTEIKGDDLPGFITVIRDKHPELASLALVPVSTPDFKDAFQDGWTKTVTALIETLTESRVPGMKRTSKRLVVLPGSHLTPGDLDELRDIIEAFGLEPVFLPDLSGSLDGHVPDDFTPTTLGGISVDEIRTLGDACHVLAIGDQMRAPALVLEERTGLPYTLLDRLTGLAANDELMEFLTRISGMPVPNKFRRQRSQLVDAMLDGHFHFGGKRVAIGAEPDLLWTFGAWLHEMGCTIGAAVTTTMSLHLAHLAIDEVLIGDLEDLEHRATDCDLLITHSHGRQAAERLGIPFFRAGIPMFDRLGAAHQVTVGYRGTRDLIFTLGNLFMADAHEADEETWRSHSPHSSLPPRESCHCAPQELVSLQDVMP
jgi:nitrogenase molybdenum-iron protein NifN